MGFPDFFDAVPALTLRDGLADFLGAAPGGRITYLYTDAVKLAGHSCGVTATAWLMVRAGLAALYDDRLPERGGLDVTFRDAAEHGTIGVTASVFQLVTGAAGEAGFHGIGPARRFSRRGLMRFGAPLDGMVGLRRRDTGRGVLLSGDHLAVPMGDELRGLFTRAVAGDLDAGDLARFGGLWQDRVRQLLLETADKVVTVKDWT